MTQFSFVNQYPDYDPNATQLLVKDQKIVDIQKLRNYQNILWNQTYKDYKPEGDDTSIYTGITGVALTKLLIASHATGEEQIQVLKDALSLISPPQKFSKPRVTFLCGNSGPLAIAAVIEHKLGNIEKAGRLVAEVVDLGKDVLDLGSNLPNELLYGRAGYFFTLLYLKENIDADIPEELFKQVIDLMIKQGAKLAKSLRLKSGLMYEWHGSYYLGAAHGLAGICYLLLQAKKYISEENLKKYIRPAIDYLASLRFLSKNYPITLDSDRDEKVQWCHGAPGYTALFCLASKVFNEGKYLELALDCGEVVWERGLLTKGYSICHGIAGNAYTFLQLYKTTGDEKHLHRALQFADWVINYTTSHEFHYPDRPLSLFEGLAGRLYFIVDIQDPLKSKFPGYEI